MVSKRGIRTDIPARSANRNDARAYRECRDAERSGSVCAAGLYVLHNQIAPQALTSGSVVNRPVETVEFWIGPGWCAVAMNGPGVGRCRGVAALV